VDNPFLRDISTNTPGSLDARNDIHDIKDYCDLCRISAISKNIYAGFGARARGEVRSISSPRYRSKKFELLIVSYIPSFIFKIVRNHARALSYIKRKIISA
jgi:hypothetical protein